ncbi:MAG: fumarylacetoacetase [Bdellovibrionales bacterium]|nr:fumarylacetoacetase [Bdellovibrionales bacterium]
MKSFLPTEEDSHFPIQNIPFGVCQRADGHAHCSTRIGDFVLDLFELEQLGIFDSLGLEVPQPFDKPSLDVFMGLPHQERKQIREAIQAVLSEDSVHKAAVKKIIVPADSVQPLLPATIGDYTDFYASRWHASNVGKMFRPDGEPLLPNWLHLPVGYHGRSSSIVPTGIPVRRPRGQIVLPDADGPIDSASRLLDYEFEMGAFFGGTGNELGSRIDVNCAAEHLVGLVIVNDWSARDIQKWEYQPLGPFNAKNFQTSISPWIVTLDALQEFRVEQPNREPSDPELLDYLKPNSSQGFNIQIETWLKSAAMNEAVKISSGNFREMWWSFEQMLAHHTSTGCPFRPGDLLASGTVSGPTKESRGCLLELTWRGTEPIELPDGSTRRFLEDGDTLTMTAFCQGAGYRIGFGELSAQIVA